MAVTKIIQVDLYHQIDSSHARKMTTWVNKHPKLKVGSEIYLVKQPKIKWQVTSIYAGEHESSDFNWHRRWDNNI